jgi:ATP-dependent Clp protease adaptor protein ClpS
MLQRMVQMPDTEIAEEVASSSDLEKLYHLILLDDNDHTYQYVVEMLGRIFGYGKDKAFTLAALVDAQGQAIVETVERDVARRHQRLVHSFGADPRITHSAGSMSAILEQAP